MKKLLALLLALVMVIGLAACGEPATPETPDEPDQTQGQDAPETTEAPTEDPEAAKYGGHLNVATESKPNLDPSKAGTWHYIWNNSVYESILTRDAEGNIQPGVCYYEVSEDMLTLKLWVKENKIFHNGDKVDINDVHASLARNTSGVHANSTKFIGAYIESMTVEGDVLTIKFTEYNEKTWYYLASWQTYNVVLPKEICDKLGQEKITTVEDAIGTGPYRVVGFETDISVSLEKFDDYVVDENGLTGMAGPKYGYMDSMTFYFNGDVGSMSMGTLNGDYDVSADFPAEYAEQAAAQGIVNTLLECNLGLAIVFNTAGDNVCAKYPDLRKAIMASLDYTDLLDVVQGEGKYALNGNPVAGAAYATDVFENADYFGEQDLEVAAKYLEAAKAAGWDPAKEPVQVVVSSALEAQSVMYQNAFTDAGIPFEVVNQEGGTWAEFTGEASNNWDFKFRWPTLGDTPLAIGAEFINTFWVNEQKDAIVAELNKLPAGSAEYVAKWNELAELYVEDCAVPHLGWLYWTWTHDGDLVMDELAECPMYDSFYNVYWTNPEEHTAG